MADRFHHLYAHAFVPQKFAATSHLFAHQSYANVAIFTLLFTFFIIGTLLLLWFMYLRQRQDELEAARLSMGGAALGLPPIPINPAALTSIIKQPFVRPPQCGFCDCVEPVLPMPSATTTFGSVMHPPSTLPILPMPPMSVTPTTLMTTTIAQSTPGSPLPPQIVQQETVAVLGSAIRGSRLDPVGTAVPSILPLVPVVPAGVGVAPVVLPVPTSYISNAGIPPELVASLHDAQNHSFESQGIKDPIFQLQQLQNTADLRRIAQQNAIIAAMNQGMMPLMIIEPPYRSEGPDIPMAQSVILGPSPTAGRNPLKRDMSPPSLPMHLTEAGNLRLSRSTPPIGIMELMPQGNILGLNALNQGAPQVVRKTTTTETTTPATLTYPMLPPMRPLTPTPGVLTPQIAPIGGIIPSAPAMRPLSPAFVRR